MNTQVLIESLDISLDSKQGIEQFKVLLLKLASHGLLLGEVDGLDASDVVKLNKTRKPEVEAEILYYRNSRGEKLPTMRIADIAEVVPQAMSKVKSSAIKERGRYPVVDQGNTFVSGFVDGIEAIQAVENPVIVFGDHTRNIKYIDFDFVVGADGVKVLRPHSLNPKYFFYMAQAVGIKSRGYGRHFREFCSSYIPIMSLRDQVNTVSALEEILSLCAKLEVSISKRNTLFDSVLKSAVNSISSAQTPEGLRLAWERINKNWEVIAGTPVSISSIRTLILDLAVRGQITPHKYSGVSAEELIAESIRLAKRVKGKQTRESQGFPFEIPSHWVWSTIEDLCETQTGTTPKLQDSDNLQELIHYVTAADMVKLKALKSRSVSISAAKRGGRIAPKDSVLFVGIGTIGKCCLIVSPATFNQQIHSATPRNINAQYLCFVLASGYFQKICKDRTSATTIPILNKSKWETINIPVPPLNEQKMIAETVSGLFELCDQLESLLTIKSSIAEKFSRSFFSGRVQGI